MKCIKAAVVIVLSTKCYSSYEKCAFASTAVPYSHASQLAQQHMPPIYI